MSKHLTSPVVVVGAGPTGLMLACELKLMGVEVTIVERRAHGTTGESRAPGINARSMEVFGQRGLAEQFRDRGRPLPAVLFSGIPMIPRKAEPGWPDALILPQHETERILAEWAGELGVSIRWSTEFVHLAQDQQGVDLIVQSGGKATTLRAQYVVGCDGGHSLVRRGCAAQLNREDSLSHWIVADVQLDSPPSDRQAFGRNTRIGTYQVSRTEPGWFRVSLLKVMPPLDRGAPVTLEELRFAMFEGLGTDYGLSSARWMSRFSDGFRQVEEYRYRRVFLAGDAGHTHSPIGGQGLNLGIQDAVNLGWKLAAVIKHGSADSLLDSYHAERRSAADGVLQMVKAQTALIKPGHQIDALREIVAKMIAVPEVTRELAGILSGLGLRYPWGEGSHPLVGRRMPNLPLAMATGAQDVFALMCTGRPLLLEFAGSPEIVVPERWVSRVDHVAVRPPTGEPIFDWRLSAVGLVPALAAAFVRPDGYVAWVSAAGEPLAAPAMIEAMAKWLD